jgi:NADP-dependent 3-hydroxy acid dehydrogenase YdfG
MIVKDRLVLVTGASSAIGAAVAKAMANAGGRVVLLARSRDLLDQVAAEISSAGGKARAYRSKIA